MRVKIVFCYHGARFLGSAPQKNNKGVIDSLQKVFAKVGENSKIVPSSRTDKGVHALRQIAHIDLRDLWSERLDYLRDILNQTLSYVKIKQLVLVSENFHARFNAVKRVYRYIVSTKELTPFDEDFFTYAPKENLNQNEIQRAMNTLIGEHNFEYFKKKGSNNKSDIRVIYNAKCYFYKDFFIFYFEANAFLRCQIRLLVSFLLSISQNKLTHKQFIEQLTRQKIHSTKPAPSSGLYLTHIIY